MTDLVLGATAGLTGWLLTYLAHSTVLLAGALLLAHALRRRPAARSSIFKVALVGGVLTSTLAVVSSGGAPDRLHLAAEARSSTDPTSIERGSLAWVPAAAGPTIEIRAHLVEPSVECRTLLRSSGPLTAPLIETVDRVCASTEGGGVAGAWFLWVVGLWLAGAAIRLAWMAGRIPALRDVEATLTHPSPRSARLFRDLLTPATKPALRHGHLRLAISEAVDTPCVLPGRTIVLPARCEGELNEAELRAVLAHEIAHVERRDVVWCGALRVLGTVFWFQPLNRLAFARLVDAAEHSCDDWALERTGERVGLARSISRVAHWSLDARRPAPGVSMAGRPRGGLVERVRRILHDDPSRREPAWVRLGLAVGLVVPLLWLPAVPPPSMIRTAVFVGEHEAVLVEMETEPAASASRATLPDTTVQEVRLLVTRIRTP